MEPSIRTPRAEFETRAHMELITYYPRDLDSLTLPA
jgi:hypothetical protein